MKVLVVGKAGSIVHWLENTADGFCALGVQVHTFSTTGSGWVERLSTRWLHLSSPDVWARVIADRLRQAIDVYRPDLVVLVGAFHLPITVYHRLAGMGHRPLLAGWVGDRFSEDMRSRAQVLDMVFYTDSAFLAEAARFGFPDNGAWLPLAVNERLFKTTDRPRTQDVVFVANRTPWREEVVRGLNRPIAVYGRGWRCLRDTQHRVSPRRYPMARLPALYAGARAVLNVRNEGNVLGGLNQRSFEPLACGTPVLNDDLPDLMRCFEPGVEVLVWRDSAELNELHRRVIEDPTFAARIGAAGRRRVLAEHTYRHRLKAMLEALGLKP